MRLLLSLALGVVHGDGHTAFEYRETAVFSQIKLEQ